MTVKPDRPTADLAGKLFDIATDLQFGFLGSLEARKGRWLLGLDVFGVSLGSQVDFRLTDGTLVEADLWALIGRLRGGYRVLERDVRVFGRCPGVFGLDLYAGARGYAVGTEVRLPDRTVEGDKVWVDPLVGVDARLDLSRRFTLRLTGDVGGFGVGSDFAWWAEAALEWRFARRWWLSVGWAVLDVDYGDAKNDYFAWEVGLSGPVVAIGYRF